MSDAKNPDPATSGAILNPPVPAPAAPPNDEPLLGKAEREEGGGKIEENAEILVETEIDKEGTRAVEWLQFGVNTVLAVIGACAIFIYYGQLDTMNKTFSEIQKQTPDIHAQAEAAKKSVEEVERQTRLDQRPWIKFQIGGIQFRPNLH